MTANQKLEQRVGSTVLRATTAMRRTYSTTLDTAASELMLIYAPSNKSFVLQGRNFVPQHILSLQPTQRTLHYVDTSLYASKSDANHAWDVLRLIARDQEEEYGTLSIGGIHNTFGRLAMNGTLLLDEQFNFYHTHDIANDDKDWLRGKSKRLLLPFVQP